MRAKTCFKSSTSTALRLDLEMEEPYVICGFSSASRDGYISLSALHMGYACASLCHSFGLRTAPSIGANVHLQKQKLCVHILLDRARRVTKKRRPDEASGFVPRGQFELEQGIGRGE